MAHAFVHLELNTDDVGKAKEFYRALFDWSFTEMSMGSSSYTSLDTGAAPGGGVQLKPMPDAPTMWLPYVSVDDVAATVARARSLGGEIVVESMAVPGFGVFGIVRDPSGATLGLWQSEPGAGKDKAARAEKKGHKAEKADKKAEKKATKKAEKAQAAAKKQQRKAEKAAKKAAKKADKKADKRAAKKAERAAEEPKKGKRHA